MEQTLFYVFGIALVVCALTVTAVGLRFENFPPSRGALVGLIVLFAALVGATGTFAWMNAEEEQSEHAAEHAEERAAAQEEEIAAEQEETAAAEGETTTTGEETAAVDGAEVFDSAGCSGCHTLADAGSTATTGPDLDGALQGKPASFIEESIVDPNKEIAKGYPPDVMPQDFGERLSPEELDALVKYLKQSTS
jgi:predicted ribosomally synthesized peptide with SipW-like signal peptide